MPAKSMKEIAALLHGVKFKRKLFGGVDEKDVWRVIAKLQGEYRAVLDAKQEGCKALIAERDRCITNLRNRLAQYEAQEARSRQQTGGEIAWRRQ